MASSLTPHGKSELRAFWRAQARQVAPATRAAAGHRVCERIRTLPEWQTATALATFWPLPDELDLTELAQTWSALGKALWLPRFNAATGNYDMATVTDPQHQLTAGHLGIQEPRPELPPADHRQANALWLVPGIAFDRHGTRLGRGKGHYDRLLADTAGCTVGVTLQATFSADPLPRERHDVPMRIIITETATERVALP